MCRHLAAFTPFALAVLAFASQPSGSVPFADEWMIETAAMDTVIHWIDDVQADETSIFARADHPVLPATAACAWVAAHREEAAAALRHQMTKGVRFGDAVLAGYLNMQDALPKIVAAWLTLDESPYSGETPLDRPAELGDFREAQAIAYVIEHLAGNRLSEAVVLSPKERQSLERRAAQDDESPAGAILSALR